MELKELTKRLCGACAPAGFEAPVFELIKEYLAPFADEIKTDALGNLMAFKYCGREGAKRIMLNAHMDEIGLITTGAKAGFLSFASLGGVDPRMLPAREVRVLGRETLYGVIDTLPPHLLEEGSADKTIDAGKLYIDIGMTQEEALKAAPIGTPVVYVSGCEELGDHWLCGKALDDRSCVAVILKAFELLSARELNVDLCCLISTQEELGYRGATVGAWNARPDIAIVVDVTHGKTPDAADQTVECGKGVVIEIGPNMNRPLVDTLISIAEEKELKYQLSVCPGGRSGTDTTAIQISRQGVVTALLSLPLKYMHTPVEMVRTDDMAAIGRLICEYIIKTGEADTNA